MSATTSRGADSQAARTLFIGDCGSHRITRGEHPPDPLRSGAADGGSTSVSDPISRRNPVGDLKATIQSEIQNMPVPGSDSTGVKGRAQSPARSDLESPIEQNSAWSSR